MGTKVCIIIPIYKEKLNKDEKLSIELVQKNLTCYDKYFVTFKGMNMRQYKRYGGIGVVYFPKRYFKNTRSYSRLLLKESFYKKFFYYKYMLIVQTDALVLGNAQMLDNFIHKDFDYWGARWEKPVEICQFDIEKKLKKKILAVFPDCGKYLFRKPKQCYVGNGGLSLRNIRKTTALLREKRLYAPLWLDNEDKFFAYHGLDNTSNYSIAPLSMVDKFAVESRIRLIHEIKPFGVHGWDRIGRFLVLRYLDHPSTV